MNIILVADVFGKTPALITLAEELNAKLIVDPYNGRNMGFKSEAEAYSYFMDSVGLEIYFSTLLAVTESLSSVSTLVGFSVGASAVWKLSGELSVNNVKRGICFYGYKLFEKGAETFFHKGINGRWKNILTKENEDLLDSVSRSTISEECSEWLISGVL